MDSKGWRTWTAEHARHRLCTREAAHTQQAIKVVVRPAEAQSSAELSSPRLQSVQMQHRSLHLKYVFQNAGGLLPEETSTALPSVKLDSHELSTGSAVRSVLLTPSLQTPWTLYTWQTRQVSKVRSQVKRAGMNAAHPVLGGILAGRDSRRNVPGSDEGASRTRGCGKRGRVRWRSSTGSNNRRQHNALLKSSTCRPESGSLNVAGPDATVVVLSRQVPLPGAGAGAMPALAAPAQAQHQLRLAWQPCWPAAQQDTHLPQAGR